MALAPKLTAEQYAQLDPDLAGHYSVQDDGTYLIQLDAAYWTPEPVAELVSSLQKTRGELKTARAELAEAQAARAQGRAELAEKLKRWNLTPTDADLDAKLTERIAAASLPFDANNLPPHIAEQLAASDKKHADEIAELQKNIDENRTALVESRRTRALQDLCANHQAFPKLLVPILRERTSVEIDEQGSLKILVLNEHGQVRLNPDGSPLSPDVLMEEFRLLDPQLQNCFQQPTPGVLWKNGRGGH